MNAEPTSAGGGFLSHVIERAQERVGVATPRLRALFEPAGAPSAAPIEETQSTRMAPVDDLARGRAPPATRQTDHLDGFPAAHDMPTHDTSEHGLRRIDVRASATIPQFTAGRSAKAAPGAAPASLHGVADAGIAPARRSPQFLHAEADDDAIDVAAREVEAARRPARSDADDRSATLLPKLDVARALVATEPGPRQARRDTPDISTPALPNVTISIGRVEVRAVQPAAAMPRASTARAPMRLDEYLERKEHTR